MDGHAFLQWISSSIALGLVIYCLYCAGLIYAAERRGRPERIPMPGSSTRMAARLAFGLATILGLLALTPRAASWTDVEKGLRRLTAQFRGAATTLRAAVPGKGRPTADVRVAGSASAAQAAPSPGSGVATAAGVVAPPSRARPAPVEAPRAEPALGPRLVASGRPAAGLAPSRALDGEPPLVALREAARPTARAADGDAAAPAAGRRRTAPARGAGDTPGPVGSVDAVVPAGTTSERAVRRTSRDGRERREPMDVRAAGSTSQRQISTPRASGGGVRGGGGVDEGLSERPAAAPVRRGDAADPGLRHAPDAGPVATARQESSARGRVAVAALTRNAKRPERRDGPRVTDEVRSSVAQPTARREIAAHPRHVDGLARSERPERAARTGALEHGARPGRIEVLQRLEALERVERVERIERPERFERAERPERPERPERVERIARPERVERAERIERPGRRG